MGRRGTTGWTVEVIDSGAGIPPQALPDLLAGRPGRRTETGIGLGLAIVRAVAGSLGGRLTISTEPSGGARVGLRVPEQVPVAGLGPAAPEPRHADAVGGPVALPDPAR